MENKGKTEKELLVEIAELKARLEKTEILVAG